MRVLILSAFLAYAAAAPSGAFYNHAPIVFAGVPAIHATVPAITAGDFQAAVIDTQVQLNDLARAAADKARELNEQNAAQLTEQANLQQLQAQQALAESQQAEALAQAKLAQSQQAEALAQQAQIQAQAPVAVAGAPVAVPAAQPVPLGDAQAAAIDTQVQIEDNARAAADKAREASEQAAEQLNEKLSSSGGYGQEQAGDALWNVEEKRWQALDAIKTAEAQIDGAIASQSPILAKSVVGGIVAAPYVAGYAPVVPSPFIKSTLNGVVVPYVAGIAPIAPSPIVYSSVITPNFSTFTSQSLTQIHGDSAVVESKSAKIEQPESVKADEGKSDNQKEETKVEAN